MLCLSVAHELSTVLCCVLCCGHRMLDPIITADLMHQGSSIKILDQYIKGQGRAKEWIAWMDVEE